ncbi:NU4M oxidoreductase, partial [Acromyrmex heyeri]
MIYIAFFIKIPIYLYKVKVKHSYLIFRIGIIGRIIVRILCLVQIDIKSIVAYFSVVHMNLMLCRLMTLLKLDVIGGYIMIISHGLCSSGIFYMVNLYYERSERRLLFLNKSLVSNLPTAIIWWFLFCIINFSFPLSLNFIGEIIILIRILNWDISILILGMGISFRPLQKDVVSSIARVFDRTARHVFERCVSKLLSPIDGIRSKRNKE